MGILSKILSKASNYLKSPADADYERAKLSEIAHFKNVENIHELPGIFHYWSNRYLMPVFVESGFSSIDQFFAKNLIGPAVAGGRFLSVGAGYCDTEIRVTKLLKQMGLKDFTLECLELNPHLLKRGRELAEAEGVSDHLLFTPTDLNHWRATATYAGVMANHSLHHVVQLESLFDNIKRSLEPGANFVASDMIGRNGHQRWPEALEIVSRFWQELPDSYRYNHQLKRHEPDYVNWDCSVEGFEGVRAQDILPLLLERFCFKYFFGFANVVSPFIDRGFGHNFDQESEWDRDFVDRLHAVDEAGFKTGSLKPTQMLAVMGTEPVAEPIYPRGLNPEFMVRSSESVG